ncbi:MAG TPA: hypothetical protein VJJ22_05120 [Candidatus Paceibacterota bacterium]
MAKSKKTKPKAIWLMGGGGMQRLACQKVKERGYKLIISDMSDKCTCKALADEFVHKDTFDIPGNLAVIDRLSKKYDIRAVLAIAADSHETAATLARRLNVHGIDPRLAHVCRYKYETRAVLTKAGIPQPKFGTATSLDEARKLLKQVGLPAVLKSTNNAGSRGFSQILQAKDLTQAAFDHALINGTSGKVIIEELLRPVTHELAEQSVETIWYDGKMYYLNATDRIFRKDLRLFPKVKAPGYKDLGWAVELGHINPSVHHLEMKKKITEMIYKAGLAIGMGKQKGGHVLKADILITNKGPYIVELTPRCSGGWDSSASSPARHADVVGGLIELGIGKVLTLDLWKKYFEFPDPTLYSAVMTKVKMGAKDCIGREFALDTSYDRQEAIQKAYNKVRKGEFLL